MKLASKAFLGDNEKFLATTKFPPVGNDPMLFGLSIQYSTYYMR